MQVSLIDEEPNPGGVCLYRGCIPSKALLHVAKLLAEAREAEAWGITYSEPKIDLDRLRGWKDEVVAKMTGGLGVLSKQRNINYVQGRGEFVGARELAVRGSGGEQKIQFDRSIIATGSRPARVGSLWLDSERMWDSTSALALEVIPKSLLVIGGGYIGLELGSVYAALGTKVTVVEMLPGLLSGADRDLVNVVAKRIGASFEAVMLSTSVAQLEETKIGIKATFQTAAGTDAPPAATFDRVLMSVGRVPNTNGLGLEAVGLAPTDRGFIEINEQRMTAVDGIYAIGDIAGEPGLAHKATHEGRTAAESAAGHRVAFEPQAIPAVVFTDPEMAWTGLTETVAKEQGRDVKVMKFPWGASGRATTMGRNDGVTKLIIDPGSERLLGMGVVGSGAGELIAEGTLAIEMAALATDLRLTIHPHPTLSETVMETADMFFGQSTHVYRPLKK
jgi:dihydrolipoamide dehydrogenase